MNSTTTAGILIAAYALLCVIVFLMGLRRALRQTTLSIPARQQVLTITSIAITGWMIVLHVLARQQVFAAEGLPPRPMFTVLLGLIIILLLSFTPTAKTILRVTPLHWLVFFQGFRIGVELWFWYAYKSGVLPRLMTFEGANLDIISGLLALVVGFLILKQPRIARVLTTIFNIAGILILLNTLRAAALSMPSPIQRYPFDERLLLLGQPYFIYLPGILVVFALGLHILSLRQLSLQKKGWPNER
jgi:hypothetical protein